MNAMPGLAQAATLAVLLMPLAAHADPNGDPKAVNSQPNGMWTDAKGVPTFKVEPGGKVDWFTYYGYVQYSGNCLQCHGPAGLGSSYGPNLVDSLKTLSFSQVMSTVAGGKRDVSSSQNLVMPAFGTNKNVMCYIYPIYVYLRARADGAVGRDRPQTDVKAPKDFNKQVDDCMG